MEKLQFKYENVNKEKILEELTEDPSLRSFFIENDLPSDTLENNLNSLLSYKTQNDYCLECDGLQMCKQDTTGLRPKLTYEEGKIKTFYHECNYLLFLNEQHRSDSMIDAMYMPKMILSADFNDYRLDTESRKRIYNSVMRFLALYSSGERMKGLYIHGPNQQGKTYTLAAIAKELTKKGFKVILAYYPDLVREFKSSIGNNTVEALVSKLKQIDILMLDDIGGEAQSAWVRDEVLGPILQYRLLDQKPTFFTSNLSIKDLALTMVENNQRAAQIKAARIISRIKEMVEEYPFK